MDNQKILSTIKNYEDWIEVEKLGQALKVQDRKELKVHLNQLKRQGAVFFNDEGQLIWTSRGSLKVGRLQVHGKGFAFLETFDQTDDAYIAEDNIGQALDQDIVIVDKFSEERGEGQVVQVLQRGLREVKGVYEKVKNYGFVTVDNPGFAVDIFIPQGQEDPAEDRDKVKVVIEEYPSVEHKNPVGKVVKKYGPAQAQKAEIEAIIDAYDIRTSFPQSIKQKAEKISSQSVGEEEDRTDLRDLFMVTIDGETAKDFDDAIHLKKEDDGFELGVHIADVSHYVKPQTSLDKEAFKRGNSVYLPSQVYPMLPQSISNGICSLKEGKDRFAFSVIMKFSPRGERENFSIFPSVINVNHRLTYSFVNEVLEGQTSAQSPLEDFLRKAKKLALQLRGKRIKEGSVDLDLKELRIVTDQQGHMTDLEAHQMTLSQKIIEEFMLAANKAVAEHFHQQEIPFLYRVHPRPEQEDVGRFIKTCRRLGHHIHKGRINSKDFQKALEYFRGSPQGVLMEEFILGAFQKARYSEAPNPHFGLAFDHYTHFTSPIRRYADLTVHRIIKRWLRDKEQTSLSRIRQVAQQTSQREDLSIELEREVNSWLKAKYMSQHKGRIFSGIVRGVMKFGLFVELENLVTGLIRLKNMSDDYYIVNEEEGVVHGTRTNEEYSVGSTVKVRVKDTDLSKREVDFELVK